MPDHEDTPPQIGPHTPIEVIAREYATIAAGYYDKIPALEAAAVRIEAAVQVASDAAHSALRSVSTASENVAKAVAIAEDLKRFVSTLDMRVGGAETKADAAQNEAKKSSTDLEKYMAETARILEARAKDPADKAMTSDRVKAIADTARKEAEKDRKADAYDEIQKTRKERRERVVKYAWKAVGAAFVVIGTGVGTILWGQCQRTAGRLDVMQQIASAPPATPAPPIVPLPFEPTTTPAIPSAIRERDAGRRP